MSKFNRRQKRNLMISTCIVALSACVSTLAYAADATTGDEVIVTAQRRSTDLQRTPLAVTSVSSQTLDQSFVVNLAGLNATVPSLEITKASGFENLVSIRGVGSETPENSLTTTPGVSLFIDGVYVANTISLDETLFDVADVEVLRGPQGALYGQSSIGGAITINSNQPVLKAWDASGDFSVGDYDLTRVRAEMNIPLGDDFALRISAQKYDHVGFTKDLAIPGFRLDDAHDGSAKAALLWKPTDNFKATLTGSFYKANQNGDAQKNLDEFSTLPGLGYSIPNAREVYQDYPAHFRLTSDLVHLNLEWDGPGFIVKSVTGYQYLDHKQQEDSSRSAFTILNASPLNPGYDDVAAWNTTVNNFNEEFDILSLPGAQFEWIAGAFYMNQKSHQFVAEFECTSFCFAPPTAAQLTVQPNIESSPPGNLSYGNDSHATHDSYAVFAQGTYHIADNMRLTGGLRWNYDKNEDPSFNFSAFGTGNSDNQASGSVVTWRVEGDYDVTPNNMLYASSARGYKPAGANGSNGQFVVPATFKAETNTAFEVGSKNYFFDKTLRVNSSLFYYIHDNFQYIETDPVPFDGGISNIPRVDDYGAEFEVAYTSPDHRLRTGINAALEHGKIVGDYKTIDSTVANYLEGIGFTGSNSDGFDAAHAYGACAFYADYASSPPSASNIACWNAVKAMAINVKGKSPPDMPDVSGSVYLSYRFTTSVGDFTPRAEVVYRGEEWARIFNDPTLDKVPAYTVTNLNIDYVPTGSRIRMSLTGTNVFNVDGINSRYTDPYGTFSTSQQYIPPRQIIGTIAYKF
jgi:iron complex outermembrane receptor protein